MVEGGAKTTRLGGFEVLGKLGKGGMGTVLKARQVSMDRVVALKILPKKLAENEGFVQRFLREARSAAKLRHPNIVQAHDVGFVDGYYYFAMEFVDGETLSQIVARDGPLEPDRALHVMKEVASALAAAHDEGMVHRDIKPANIMLDKKGEVRVTDFGLAKHTEGDVQVTADGAVVGTPSYVAPEMAKGGEADHRSDLYSLGATVFCILAGRPPFEGKNFSEVLIKQVNETAPPLASLAPRVDRRLCHIVDRLLRKNPEARYPTATALLDDLNGLGKLQSVAAAARAEGRAMLAEAPTLEMSEGKRREREARVEAQGPRSNRTTLIAVGAIVAILAIAGLILALRSGSKPPATATKLPSSVPDSRKPITGNRVEPPAKTPEVAKKSTPVEPKRPTPPEPPVPRPGESVSLFDGTTLKGWRVVEEDEFVGHGPVSVTEGHILLEKGRARCGIAWTGEFPTTDYEVELEARREAGTELVEIGFPVGTSGCILNVGSMAGTVLGLSLVDGRLGWENETRRPVSIQTGRWYRVRLRVTKSAIMAWLDGQLVVHLPRAGRQVSLGWMWPAKPFGMGAFGTTLGIRGIRMRRVEPGAPETPVAAPPVTPKVAALATVSFTAPSESKGLAPVSEGDGQFTTAEREGKPALCQEANNPNRAYLYFRAGDDFAKLFQADSGRTALVTITLLDSAQGLMDINYDSHVEYPGEPENATIWRRSLQQRRLGTGKWTQMKFELPNARFGHRQNFGADFRIWHEGELAVHQVTVSAVAEDPPPKVPPQLEQGLAVAFYAGQNHERFVVARRAPCVYLLPCGAPMPNVPEDSFSTRIVGWLHVPEAGEYTFRFRRDDGARLYLDAEVVIDQWGAWAPDPEPVTVRLGAGWHRLWVEHMDTIAEAHLLLYWRRGDSEALVPHTLLYCEREMLERIRREPTKDPFAGLTPQTPAKAPDQPAEAPPEPKKGAAVPDKLPGPRAQPLPAPAIARKGEERGETLEQALDRIAKAAAGVRDFSLKYTTNLPGNETGFDEDVVQTGEIQALREGKTWLFRHTSTMAPAKPAKPKAKGGAAPAAMGVLEVCDGQVCWREAKTEQGRKAMKEDPPPPGLPDAMLCLCTLYPGWAEDVRKAQNMKLAGKGTFAGRTTTIIEQTGEPQAGKDVEPKGKGLPERMVVHFDDASGLVVRVTITDKGGKERPFETLSELRVNSGLKRDLFKYTPPPGVKVENQPPP